ncbi:MAG: oligosaccharide flippase family protein [Chitinophagaceae bacterium]|nr:oligosaccharide flippase family protein [Chitinophagaceae bacterium]
MSGIKKLAGQTLWYGLSSIAARFIGYLLTPLLTYSSHVRTADFGRQSLLYSAIPVLSVLFTYGFETAYFRFSGKEENKKTIYSTSFLSILGSTIIFSLILWQYRGVLGSIVGFADIPQIAELTIGIIAIDTLCTIPFARLRQEERPVKYAFVRVAGILINLLLVWFFVNYCPAQLEKDPNHWVGRIFDMNTNPIIYVAIANLVQSILTFLLLGKEVSAVRFSFNARLWKEMIIYALPLLIVGFGGIVNETFDRLMLKAWLPGSADYRNEQVGIYNACYKLSLLITLFVQAFRMGAEPFFFKQAEGQNPQRVYARVMKFFVLVVTLMFLVVALFLPVWSRLIGPKYRVGLQIVPILLLANIFLGVYYNLSIWFKLSHKTIAGAYITLIGTAITLVVNYFFIPEYGYIASALATFFCYGSMMVISYYWGQKAYPVPYATKKLVAYGVIVVLLFLIHKLITHFFPNVYLSLSLGALLTAAYAWFVLQVEKKEFQKLPLIGRYLRPRVAQADLGNNR